ncbi:MAG: hypothetical protein KF765_01405 [Parvibaculaceae bacterium]|nr:hypothetical protein [Parvibaculaceae bacterium]
MMNPSLVVKGRAKSLIFALTSISFGTAILFTGNKLIGRECSPGRNEFICDLMAKLPPWAELSIFIFFGALCVYIGLRVLLLVLRGAVLLALDEKGITFDSAGPVFVPWHDVRSISTSRRIVTVKSSTPQRVQHIFGWSRETDKFAIPLWFGRAYIGGKFQWGSAANVIRKRLHESSTPNPERREPGMGARI